MKYLILIFFCVISLIACKKATIQSVATNNTKDSLSYQPQVPGSKWSYQRTVSNVSNTTFNFLRLTYDTMAYGDTFQVFSSDDVATSKLNQYVRRSGDKYYSILTGSTNKPSLLVLDAAKNVNESWVGGTNGSDTYNFTMKQKIPVYVLDTFTFKNVLVVHLDRTGPNPASGDTYYAQGVGQVKSVGTVNFGGINLPTDVKVLTVDLK